MAIKKTTTEEKYTAAEFEELVLARLFPAYNSIEFDIGYDDNDRDGNYPYLKNVTMRKIMEHDIENIQQQG